MNKLMPEGFTISNHTPGLQKFIGFFSDFERWLELHRVNEGLSVINRMKQLNSIQIASCEHL
ncbi:hypothetical protein, partial [Bacillus cereus]|uniref:hypothetical protein n=1 Tax=Bacillus cereus TaxID=1396 RepID=UPI002ACB0B93